jgi:hypothetical protein
MADKDKLIVDGNYELFPSNTQQAPAENQEHSDTFVERWVRVVHTSYESMGMDINGAIPGIVLAVEKSGKVTPDGARDRANAVSSTPTETCLKMWVHTKFDSALAVPKNFLNPGVQTDLIYEHFVFEAQNAEVDKIVPKPGDIVKVIHPWSQGFTNKVGTYIGKFAAGMAPTFDKASNNFKNTNSRKKNIPK